MSAHAGRHAVRHDRSGSAQCGFKTNPLTKVCGSVEALLAFHRAIEARARHARLRHRRRRLQGRPPRLAGAARLRLAHAALGDRAQVPGREGDHRRQGDRDPGRPHRRAHAGRQARAGDGRRRGGAERDPAQRGRDRAPRRAHRRHGDDPARRRRHPAGARRRRRRSGRRTRSPIEFPNDLPVRAQDAGRARDDRDRRGGRGRRCTRRVRLPVPAGRASASISCRAAPSTSRGWARSRSSCSSSEGWIKEPADIFTLEARNAEIKLEERRRLRRDLGAQPVRRDRRAARDRARPLHLRARHPPRRRDHGARARPRLRHRGRPSTTPACKVADGDEETRAGDGRARPDRRHGDRQPRRLFRASRTTAASSSG